MKNPYGPMIEVGGSRYDKNWLFWIKDNGIGIEEYHQKRIFEVFYRVQSIHAEGTGIGLAIAKKIIESYKGKIWVSSKKGKGTTFYFTLPLEIYFSKTK